MAYVPVNVVLDRPLTAGNSVNIPYPEGRNEGHFFSAVNHTMTVDGSFYRCPKDFLITTMPDRIMLLWQGGFAIPSRSVLNIQLETPGSDNYFDAKNAVAVTNMVHSQMFMVNLGAPTAPVDDCYVARQNVTTPQSLKLTYDRPDCPRNVVIYSTQANAQCTFLIEGADLYGRSLKENIIGANAGKKAFGRIRKISAGAPCEGEVWIGTGDRLGLPVFLPAPGYLIREIINGKKVDNGAVASGDAGLPLPTSGDCRGTYTPPAGIQLDGKHTIHLLVSLPNPGNIGLADFT